MPQARSSRQQVATYLGLVFPFSALFYFLILRAQTLRAGGGLYVVGLMWCPGLAGILTLKLNGRKLAELGWKWPTLSNAAMSWYVPLLYAAIAYAIVWGFRLGGFPNHDFMRDLGERMGLRLSPARSTVVYALLMGTFGLVGSLAHTLGEEIGWRGFLVPELSKTMSFTGTALISAIVWACWHYPVLIWGDYNAGTPSWYGLTCLSYLRGCGSNRAAFGLGPCSMPAIIYTFRRSSLHLLPIRARLRGLSTNSAPCCRSWWPHLPSISGAGAKNLSSNPRPRCAHRGAGPWSSRSEASQNRGGQESQGARHYGLSL